MFRSWRIGLPSARKTRRLAERTLPEVLLESCERSAGAAAILGTAISTLTDLLAHPARVLKREMAALLLWIDPDDTRRNGQRDERDDQRPECIAGFASDVCNGATIDRAHSQD